MSLKIEQSIQGQNALDDRKIENVSGNKNAKDLMDEEDIEQHPNDKNKNIVLLSHKKAPKNESPRLF